jgi:NADH dehydrogenase
VLRDQANARVLLGEVTGLDTGKREAILDDGRRLAYDWLVFATGATHNYFGHDDWAAHAPGLKRVDDATLVRRRILLAFERAENASDEGERRKLMTFAIVGAGPTGVELAGAIAELARHALASDFRAIDPRAARIVLIEGGERVLPVFAPNLSAYAQRALAKMDVEVWLGKQVTACDADGLVASGQRLDCATILWAAGVSASPAARWLGAPADRAGRVQVTASLTAPAAKQEGHYVAGVIKAALAGKAAPKPFRYRHDGNLATIGRNAAVIDFGKFTLKGFFAWLIWAIVHVYFLIGTRNRLLVALQWIYSYVTFGRGARLIVGSDTTAQRTP